MDDGHNQEQIQLDAELDPKNWPDDAWSTRCRDATLEDDAAETIAAELQEVLRLWDRTWPVCPRHGGRLDPCSGVRVCEGPPVHDITLGGLDRR